MPGDVATTVEDDQDGRVTILSSATDDQVVDDAADLAGDDLGHSFWKPQRTTVSAGTGGPPGPQSGAKNTACRGSSRADHIDGRTRGGNQSALQSASRLNQLHTSTAGASRPLWPAAALGPGERCGPELRCPYRPAPAVWLVPRGIFGACVSAGAGVRRDSACRWRLQLCAAVHERGARFLCASHGTSRGEEDEHRRVFHQSLAEAGEHRAEYRLQHEGNCEQFGCPGADECGPARDPGRRPPAPGRSECKQASSPAFPPGSRCSAY